MHAVTWRTVRCRPKFPAALVAGQRRPLRNRPFHRTTRALKADDASKDSQGAESSAQASDPPPKDDNVAPTGDQNQPDPAPAVKLARGVEAAENNAEYLKAEIQAARKKIKRFSSQLSKVNGVNQASGIPPVHIPPWFLRLNVALHDEARPGAPSDGKPKIEGSLCINGISEEEEELLRLALPMPPKLWDALETAAKEKQDQKENVTNAAAFYSGFLQFINKYYRDAEGAKTENGSGPAKWKLKEDLGVHFSLYLETLTAMAGSLHAKHLENANSFPAAKSNLVLHCPVDGGIPQLEDLVQDISNKLQADLVTLGPQDIAELVGEYVGEGSDLASQSLRYLGYQTHRSQFENMAEEEEFEDAEEEEGEESQEHTHPIPRPRGNGKRQAFIIQGFPARASFSDLFKAIDGRRPNGPMSGEMLGPGMGVNRPSSPQWDEIKLDASLKALLDAPSTKRTRLQDQTLQSTNTGTESQNSQPAEVDTAQTEGEEEKLVLGQTKSFRLTLDKSLQNVPKIPGPERKRTVVLIKDYKELSTTQHGGHIIDKLTDIVRKRREDGEEIMIVGITSSAELFPEVSRAGVRRMQAENETDFARTIVVPLGPITIDSLASAVDRRNETFGEGLDLTKEEFLRIRDINVRHIFDMIGQLDPDALDPVYADESRRHDVYERNKDWYDNEGRAIELTGPHLNRRVLAFHEVHRLAQTIVGLLRATTRTQHASRLVVQLAILLLRLSDDVKLSWATNERLLESARLSFKTMNTTPKSESQSTLDAVAKSADKTEKKLLPGIVDPKAIKTTFDDVHVPDETKDALKTLISLSMQRPDAFKYGVLANDKMPGLLLYGPPGTGKTLLAKAVAKESGATVLQISASEIYEMWVGESEKNVRAVFSLARKLSPCVVFIDEADSLFGTRAGGKHKAHQKDTLNQFLKEWDGMNDLSVFIMVATNRPFDMDDAVLRRLPRRVLVDLPTERDREAILRIHLKGELLDEKLDLRDVARRTPFYSGSDLKNLCVAAALNCVKEENVAAAEKKKKKKQQQQQQQQEEAEAAASATPPSPESPSPSSEPRQPHDQPPKDESLYPPRRTLHTRHFAAAFEEIGASISEDMASLVSIRKFDDQFGDNRKNKKKKSAWGFQTNRWEAGEEAVRVRK
ncbi:ATPase family AAA domain-containing protein 1-A [Phyllosticta citrichinensis]|uniref:ATPase family AAA domain-containing protein 1-A n=1 Tax=Phyllosticta citrichinensis TaxID=1130410 RepID=A0ABR1Y0Y6_9PEZI